MEPHLRATRPVALLARRCAATVSNAVDPPLSRGRRRMGELLELVLEPISKLSEQDHKASELDEAE